jgi:hypothetical protein
MLHFNKDELKHILNALETIQQARQAITTEAVIEGNYIKADAAYKQTAEREQIINRIKAHLQTT